VNVVSVVNMVGSMGTMNAVSAVTRQCDMHSEHGELMNMLSMEQDNGYVELRMEHENSCYEMIRVSPTGMTKRVRERDQTGTTKRANVRPMGPCVTKWVRPSGTKGMSNGSM